MRVEKNGGDDSATCCPTRPRPTTLEKEDKTGFHFIAISFP